MTDEEVGELWRDLIKPVKLNYDGLLRHDGCIALIEKLVEERFKSRQISHYRDRTGGPEPTMADARRDLGLPEK